MLCIRSLARLGRQQEQITRNQEVTSSVASNNYFERGKLGHFAADCPDKNKFKSGYYYNKNKDNVKKYHERDNRKKAKARAFIASLRTTHMFNLLPQGFDRMTTALTGNPDRFGLSVALSHEQMATVSSASSR